ncbi:hypothetical protein PQO01_15975 [Lentisphaera marina]|nr:hypothetical protein [Lentisphaera marina]MDD7986449.1 hypothetical protein [Lentisphaera marina]
MNKLIDNNLFAHETFLSHNHEFDNAQILAVTVLLALGIIAYFCKKQSV